MSERNEISETIQELCAEKGISVNKLALQAGLRQSTVDSILKGKSVNPRMDTLEKLADGFGMDRAEFWVRIRSKNTELTPNQKRFTGNLRRLRESTGLSMKDFETKLGLDDGYYPYWETGIFPPTIDFLISIAQFFRVSLDYLLGLTDESGQGQAAAKDGPVT